jgi:hypothetical protein
LSVHEQAGDPARAREDVAPFSNTEFGFAPFPSMPRRPAGTEEMTADADEAQPGVPVPVTDSPAARRLDD